MDHRLRELERQALSGDPEAQMRLQYAECRMGSHILRDDQIILSQDQWQANNDVGGCQCGQKLFNAHELCELGHHRMVYRQRSYYNGPELQPLLTYWCARLRPGVSVRSLCDGTHPVSENPLVGGMGCDFHLTGSQACKKGLHFLEKQEGGMVCRNPECNYVDPINCKSHDLNRARYDNEGTEVSNCSICWTQFTGTEICKAGLHRPDRAVGEDCVREGCDLFKGGMNLYEAMVATHKATGKLEAVCHINGRLIAKASGWNEKLKALGIKKPKLPPEKKPRRSKLFKRYNTYTNRANTYRVTVRYTLTSPHLSHPNLYNWHCNQRENYTEIGEKLKSFWAGNWYPTYE